MKFIVVHTEQGMEAWEIGTEGIIHASILDGAPPRPVGTVFSPQRDMVALYLDRNRLGVWNMRTGARAGPEYTSQNYIRGSTPQFSPDGRRLAFGTADGTSMIIDVATGRVDVSFATRALVPVYALRFSPDGRHVVTLNDRNETSIWNAATGKLVTHAREALDTKMLGLSRYSPDGRWFATLSVQSIHLWDGTTGARAGEAIPVWQSDGSFSADSRSFGTADGNGRVRVWDVPGGQPFTEPMRDVSGPKTQPEFSPDGRFLRAEHPRKFVIWSVPSRLPEGTSVPDWLHRLATLFAAKSVNAAGALIDLPRAMAEYDEVRREIAALPVDAPLAEWGRWILNDKADRSIAPGFTFTKTESDQLAPVDAATEP